MSAATTTAWAQLEALRAQVRDAEAHLAELETEARDVVARYRGLRAAHLAELEDVEAGRRKRDEEAERELLAELDELERRLTMKPNQMGGVDPVDERLEARIAGARAALDGRRDAVAAFMRRGFGDLAFELTAEAREAAERVNAALPELLEAEAGYRRIRARWRPLLEANGLPFTLPANPLRGFADEVGPGGVAIPVPDALGDD